MNNNWNDSERRQNWLDLAKEHNIRPCKQCGASIANNLRYGRRQSKDDYKLCECCETITPKEYQLAVLERKLEGLKRCPIGSSGYSKIDPLQKKIDQLKTS